MELSQCMRDGRQESDFENGERKTAIGGKRRERGRDGAKEKRRRERWTRNGFDGAGVTAGRGARRECGGRWELGK